MRTLHLDGRPLALETLAQAAAGPLRITLAQDLRDRLTAARQVVDRFAAGETPVYGLNTGLGGNLGHRLSPGEIPAFQEQVLAGRSVGVGEPLPEPVSRAALLARIVGVSKGVSGLSPAAMDLMMAMAGRGLSPVIRSRGSIGAGDLTLGAQMGATLLGRGELWDEGRRRPALDALREAGLAPVELGAKDALALSNHSAVTTGFAIVTLQGAIRLMDLAQGVAALSGEGYGMNPSIFDPRLHALRPAGGQEAAAAWFRKALEGSSLFDPEAAHAIQDALSFRVLAPLFGAARTALARAVAEVEAELNGAADSPVVLVEAGEMLSTPNFHTPAIALAFDGLAIAQVQLATASFQRIVKLMAPQLSGLPKYLSRQGGAAAGFMPMQKTAAALLGEVRLYAAPASLDAMPVSEMVEDVAPQTPLTIRKLQAQCEPLRLLAGVEALVAAQAVDLRAPRALGRVARALHEAIRAELPALDRDRASGPEVEVALSRIQADEIAALLRSISAE